MKKNLIGLSLFLLSFITINAQTAEELVAKNIEARGGIEKLKALKGIIYEGTMQQQGVEIAMKFYYFHNVATRVEYSAMGQSGYTIITTTQGWAFNPFAGNDAAEALPEDAVKESQSQLDVHGPLVDYKEKGNKVEYLGKVTEQGVEYYKLKLTRSNGKVITYHLDKSYLVTKATSTAMVNGAEQEVTTEYSDYRKTPEGYTVAFHRINSNMDVTFDKVIINPLYKESLFKPTN